MKVKKSNNFRHITSLLYQSFRSLGILIDLLGLDVNTWVLLNGLQVRFLHVIARASGKERNMSLGK